ncbi:MAG: HAD family hydrolase [Candidatus Atribacteria bacterium]|nr:HAD family hydrolase [Candidatus Atribacteria bacterium]
MLKAVLFDIDGTITDTNYVFVETVIQTYAEFIGKVKPPEFFYFLFGMPSPESLKILGIPEEKVLPFITRWQELIKKEMYRVKLFPGIVEVIEELFHRGLFMALVTSKIRSELPYQFDCFGLNHYFQTVICAEDTPKPKPSPDPLLRACQKLRVSPSNTVFIGDSRYDIIAAKEAHLPFLFASWGTLDPAPVRILHPEYDLEKPLDILTVVKSLLPQKETGKDLCAHKILLPQGM